MDPDHATPATAAARPTPEPDAVIKIAAIDDHPVVLDGLAGRLTQMTGLRLVATATSVEKLLTSDVTELDVVLLDLDLGARTNVTDNIQRLLAAGARVVVFSVTDSPAAVREAMRAGASGYVQKTETLDELAMAVRAAAAGEDWVSSHLAFLLLTDDSPDRPSLSDQELMALRLYATGMPMKSVARRMSIGQETAKQYVDRVRDKYRRAGREAGTKIDLYKRAVEDGHLPSQ